MQEASSSGVVEGAGEVWGAMFEKRDTQLFQLERILLTSRALNSLLLGSIKSCGADVKLLWSFLVK